MYVELSQDAMTESCGIITDALLERDEVELVAIRSVTLNKDQTPEERAEALEQGIAECWHDEYSDVDMTVNVCINTADLDLWPQYLRDISVCGIERDELLGASFDDRGQLMRLALKDGMRYDIKYALRHTGGAPHIAPEHPYVDDNPKWQLESVDRFWFIMIQALGKLYRGDYLIADHLANMQLNDTLVMQMVLRDIERGTNIHRYGRRESLVYAEFEAAAPCEPCDDVFDSIAAKLVGAAQACDALAAEFYGNSYEPRTDDFMDIWSEYDEYRAF